MKRKHSKIDKLPSDIKEAVEQMILGDYTYRDVCDFVRDTANVTLSEAAVCRYAQGLNASVQEIRLASENMRALTEEMQKFPQLDTTEGIARLRYCRQSSRWTKLPSRKPTRSSSSKRQRR